MAETVPFMDKILPVKRKNGKRAISGGLSERFSSPHPPGKHDSTHGSNHSWKPRCMPHKSEVHQEQWKSALPDFMEVGGETSMTYLPLITTAAFLC